MFIVIFTLLYGELVGGDQGCSIQPPPVLLSGSSRWGSLWRQVSACLKLPPCLPLFLHQIGSLHFLRQHGGFSHLSAAALPTLHQLVRKLTEPLISSFG